MIGTVRYYHSYPGQAINAHNANLFRAFQKA